MLHVSSMSHLHIAGQVDGELGGVEDVQGGWPVGQGVPGSNPPDEGALAGLAHSKVASVQYTKAHLHTWSMEVVGRHLHSKLTDDKAG